MEPPVGGRRRQEEEGMSLSRLLGGRGERVTDLGAKELPVFQQKMTNLIQKLFCFYDKK